MLHLQFINHFHELRILAFAFTNTLNPLWLRMWVRSMSTNVGVGSGKPCLARMHMIGKSNLRLTCLNRKFSILCRPVSTPSLCIYIQYPMHRVQYTTTQALIELPFGRARLYLEAAKANPSTISRWTVFTVCNSKQWSWLRIISHFWFFTIPGLGEVFLSLFQRGSQHILRSTTRYQKVGDVPAIWRRCICTCCWTHRD